MTTDFDAPLLSDSDLPDDEEERSPVDIETEHTTEGEELSRLDLCEERIGYRFDDRDLLRQCLTHSSIATTRLRSNERLEFLGDAVMGMLICEVLYEQFPESEEGELTRLKSALVSRSTCTRVAKRFELQDCVLVGKGLSSQYRLPNSILAAVIEALIAGVYIDGGLEATRTLLHTLFDVEIDRHAQTGPVINFKSRLQQYCQREFSIMPRYRLLDERGPDHSKCFQVAAAIGSEMFPAAWGPNKKEAEQLAAQNALAVINGEGGDEEE